MYSDFPISVSRNLYWPSEVEKLKELVLSAPMPSCKSPAEWKPANFFDPFKSSKYVKALPLPMVKELNIEEEKIGCDLPSPSAGLNQDISKEEKIDSPKLEKSSPAQDLEVIDGRNVLIETREGVKYVKNSQGVEFVYYENLEEVRRILKKQFPSMNKAEMYKELLRPYRYSVVNADDTTWASSKQIYQWGYENWTKKFSKTWNLVDHLRMHEGIRPYKCHIWKKLFTQKGNLQKHLKQHVITDVEKRKKFKWDFWGKGYTERYNWLVSAL